MLPEALRAEIRAAATEAVRQHAVPRREFEALRAVLAALQPPLKPEDHAALSLLIPALMALFGREIITARQIVQLAATTPGPHGDALRAVLAIFNGTKKTNSLGWLLRRCIGREVGGVFLLRLDDPTTNRDGGTYVLMGF